MEESDGSSFGRRKTNPKTSTFAPHEPAFLLRVSCSLTAGRRVRATITSHPLHVRDTNTPMPSGTFQPTLWSSSGSPPHTQEHEGSAGTNGLCKPSGLEREGGLNWGHGTPLVPRLQSNSCRQTPAGQHRRAQEGGRE